ncbi:ABC transporter permease [Singulisphaera rosea]
MSALLSLPLLWSQSVLPGIPDQFRAPVLWLLVFGEPSVTIPGLFGALIDWVKILSLFCLLGWVASWVSTALKERTISKSKWLNAAVLASLIVGLIAIVVRVVEASGTAGNIYKVGGYPVVTGLAILCGLLAFLWIETALWSTIRRLGKSTDLLVLLGIHVGLVLGIGIGVYMQQASKSVPLPEGTTQYMSLGQGISSGARLSATYMGYVVLLRVLGLVISEVVAVRWRRLYAIAKLSVIEATRRMWAPWVVITVFLVVLAFTHWFLQPPRAAEMGRLFVGTLSLLCSLLLTVMITILTPLSLPQDIQQQTIYTVVSKPVRRIELIWGRMLGFMAIVTFLVAIFGGISLLYLWRTIYTGTIVATEERAQKAEEKGRTAEANHLREEAFQLRNRMSAREPIRGSLTFLDSRGTSHVRGIDVGQEQSMREPRSHIEGATPAAAIWQFGIVQDPYQPGVYINRQIPVDRLLRADSVEGLLNAVNELKGQINETQRKQANPKLSPDEGRKLSDSLARDRESLKSAESDYNKLLAESNGLEKKAAAADAAKNKAEADSLRNQVRALHSDDIPVEMNFNVYRTTKGKIGEPVYAEITVTNPGSLDKPYSNIIPIREYYTNRHYLPARYLAGSRGFLRIEVRCLSPTQYLGMAESDLYVLAHAGDFGTNYMKGLFGVWLQAMVLTAIGVFAGTFLSWPVALLTTIAFFIAGQVAFAFLLDFSRQSLLGGGPFESLIRLLTHDNQMSDLAPTMAVVTAQTFDSILMPVMSRLVYVVPNFAALDVSNTVAEGYVVRWSLLATNFFLALAYALPFSIAGYFILKNREVAA